MKKRIFGGIGIVLILSVFIVWANTENFTINMKTVAIIIETFIDIISKLFLPVFALSWQIKSYNDNKKMEKLKPPHSLEHRENLKREYRDFKKNSPTYTSFAEIADTLDTLAISLTDPEKAELLRLGYSESEIYEMRKK